MKRLLATTLVVLLSLPLSALGSDNLIQEERDVALRPGDVFIPREFRIRNERSNCVFAASETIVSAAGYQSFKGMKERAVREGWHGASLRNVLSALTAAGIPHKSQEAGNHDPQILFDSVKEGTGCYIQIPGHAIALVGIDAESARIIDNNGPPSVQVWPRAKFDRLWEGACVYPLSRVKLVWRKVGTVEYLYRGQTRIGAWNPATQVWWAWDGKQHAKGIPPWEKKWSDS